MGAGENALFEIFSTIFSTPRGTLLVIDEIELGLHEDAQKKFIHELKAVCKERHIQVICTTHSPAILNSVPPEARFFIQSYPEKTIIHTGIASLHAAGKLSGENSKELDIYVEDETAQYIVESFIDHETRKRVTIIPIGSPQAIIHQMAARYKDQKKDECIAIMDGDQIVNTSTFLGQFIKALESCPDEDKARTWFEERLTFIPGNTWPEYWLVDTILSLDLNELTDFLNINLEDLRTYLEKAKNAGKHNEFYCLAQDLCLESSDVFPVVARMVAKQRREAFTQIDEIFRSHLS